MNLRKGSEMDSIRINTAKNYKGRDVLESHYHPRPEGIQYIFLFSKYICINNSMFKSYKEKILNKQYLQCKTSFKMHRLISQNPNSEGHMQEIKCLQCI